MEQSLSMENHVDQKDKSIRFWNRFAARYSRKPVADQETYEKKLGWTQEHLRPDSRVLEFGCGTGSTALIHAEHVEHIVAIDSSQKMIEIARGKLEGEAKDVKNVEFFTATLADLPHPPESFDAVLGLNVLHLIDDMEGAVRKCYELLKPGGVLVHSTACAGDGSWFMRKVLPMGGKLGLIPKLNIFGIEELEAAMERAGFRTLKKHRPHKGTDFMYFMIAQKPA